jgi:lipid-binding SYLF domain-containing protein
VTEFTCVVKHILGWAMVSALIMASLLVAGPEGLAAGTSGFSEQQQLIDKAVLTIERFGADPNLKDGLHLWSSQAKALFIVPQMVRGAFIFGGAGGSGVLLVKDEKTGQWSQPAFYTIGSASFGLQVGGDVSEIVMVVRNRKGLEEFYTTDVKLGSEVGLAAGPASRDVAAKGIAGDIISYANMKGAFAGLALDGAVIAVSDAGNEGYYGKPVRPVDIVLKKDVSNEGSAKLRAAVAQLMKKH